MKVLAAPLHCQGQTARQESPGALHSCMSTQRYHENLLGTNPPPTPCTPGLGGGNIMVRMWEVASFRDKDKQMNVYLENHGGFREGFLEMGALG